MDGEETGTWYKKSDTQQQEMKGNKKSKKSQKKEKKDKGKAGDPPST